ncbi:hypothetical protein PAHAL_2G081300 [Panicum hallii]|uniref:Uncharacterized protein n=1 Tax=Panicum hallii TaxID=206008 RepID=A0A2T8KNB1_9POAL|nr:hypothetical protein PAHAL_2G081300 [Panicum hallii]
MAPPAAGRGRGRRTSWRCGAQGAGRGSRRSSCRRRALPIPSAPARAAAPASVRLPCGAMPRKAVGETMQACVRPLLLGLTTIFGPLARRGGSSPWSLPHRRGPLAGRQPRRTPSRWRYRRGLAAAAAARRVQHRRSVAMVLRRATSRRIL